MLEAKFEQAALLKKIIEAIREQVADCNFDFSENGIALQAMDNTHIALVSMLLGTDGFSEYRCDRNVALGLNVVSLSKILRCGNNEDRLTLRAEDQPEKLQIIFEDPERERISEYDIKLMDIDQEQLEVPETEYESTVTMPSSDFLRICRDIKSLSESVTIETDKSSIRFKATGDFANANILLSKHVDSEKSERNIDIQVTEPTSLTLNVEYLLNFCRASTLSTQVYLRMSNDVPMMVEFSLPSGYLRFHLAPKIGEGDE